MKKNEKGFTLIELLVVVAIIGILAAIAIPQFAAYRQRAFDARAQSDLRNAMTAEEAYFVDNEKYVAATEATAAGLLPGFRPSENVVLKITSTDVAWAGCSNHPQGISKYTFDSAATTGLIKGAGVCP